MNATTFRGVVAVGLALSTAGLGLFQVPLRAQPPLWVYPPLMPSPTTPMAQRAAMDNVRARVNSLKNATATAPNYATGGDGLVWRAFQALCIDYTAFTRSLNPQQAAYGANELAELTAGLSILEEAFANFRDDVAVGRPPAKALGDM